MPAPSADRAARDPRILIVRLSALGDIVFATSLLDALRARWPAAHVGWLVQANFAGVLAHDPRIDARIAVEREAFRSPRRLLALRRELRAQRYDLVIDAQGLAKSRLLAALAGGRRVGFASKEPGGFLLHEQVAKAGTPGHIAREYRALATHLTGLVAGPPRLPVSEAARATVQAALAQHGLASGFVALCPFTTRPQKHWPEAHWPQLAAALHARGLGPCVLFGGPGDVEAAQRIGAATATPLLNLVGQTRLADLAAWLSVARLVIGVDTGLTHIGIAVGTPTVALFGSTCPYTGGADSPLAVMYDALPCAPCRRHPTCGGAYTCMSGLVPARVAATAAALVENAP